MPLRIKTTALLVAIATISAAAEAQTYAFSRTELGRIVPTRFVTSAQQLLASTDIAVSAPTIATVAATSASSDLLRDTESPDTWSAVERVTADEDEEKTESASTSFFGSTIGRASIAGLAGIAGASYFALRTDAARTAERELFYTVGSTLDTRSTATGTSSLSGAGFVFRNAPDFPVNTVPEPATYALMAAGLGVLGMVARRRRTN
jgi:hypothetical protein